MSTTEVILKYYANVNAGDWDTWLTLFDENLVMDEQLMGHVEGLGALADVADGLESRVQEVPDVSRSTSSSKATRRR